MNMITLDFGNRQYNIASSYEELTLGQYADILKINDMKIKLSGYDADIKVLSVLCDKPEEIKDELWKLNIDDFTELCSYFDWVQDTTIIESFKQMPKKPRITVDGKDYSVMTDFNKQMSLTSIISFETTLKNFTDLHQYEIAFATIIRPLDEAGQIVEFSTETFEEILSIKYKVKMIDIFSTLAFFLSGEKKSTTNNTKAFSVRHN